MTGAFWRRSSAPFPESAQSCPGVKTQWIGGGYPVAPLLLKSRMSDEDFKNMQIPKVLPMLRRSAGATREEIRDELGLSLKVVQVVLEDHQHYGRAQYRNEKRPCKGGGPLRRTKVWIATP